MVNPQFKVTGKLACGIDFFRPYAEKFNEIALDAGFDNHDGVVISHGGENRKSC